MYSVPLMILCWMHVVSILKAYGRDSHLCIGTTVVPPDVHLLALNHITPSLLLCLSLMLALMVSLTQYFFTLETPVDKTISRPEQAIKWALNAPLTGSTTSSLLFPRSNELSFKHFHPC